MGDSPPDLDAPVVLLRAGEPDGLGTIAATHVRAAYPAVPAELAGRVADPQDRLDTGG